MVSGLGECMGTELALNQPYKFNDCDKYWNIFRVVDLRCIFTWHGCTIKIEGECHAYVSEETPMNIYANTHGILQV